MRIEQFMEHVFSGKIRKTGDSYTSHPYAVRDLLIKQGVTEQSILDAAVLHDVIEDSHITKDYLSLRFGAKVAEIVSILSKSTAWLTSYCKMKSNLDQMENQWVQYPEAILIKMADRLHNLQTINGFKPEKQKEYLKETTEMLMPLFSSIIRQNNLSSLDKPFKGLYSELEKEITIAQHNLVS